tara:strand:- start:280 stop:606 length:327 start_codon:yes stop_codon:yes gene_type:complete
MTYTWNNKTVDTYPSLEGESDVIFNVHWRLTGTDDSDNTGGVYGTQSLETSDLSDFTSFADITEDDINGWVEAAMGEEEVQAKKDAIDAQIAEKVNPTVVTKTIGATE